MQTVTIAGTDDLSDEHRRMWDDIEVARAAVELSVNSYGDIAEMKRVSNRATSANCYIGERQGCQLVVYTGSNAFLDWVFNFLPIPVKYGKGWVHWGFALAHKSIWKRVRAHLDPSKPILFIGHSAGGALADLSTDFVDEFPERGYVTFGKPNLRTKKDKDEYHSMAHLFIKLSVMNCGDVVPTIPRVLFGPHPEQDTLYRDWSGVSHFNSRREFRKADRARFKYIKGHFIEYYAVWLHSLKDVKVWTHALPTEAANDPIELEKSA